MARTRPAPPLLCGLQVAVIRLGCGFLDHPASAALNRRLASGALGVGEYYPQLLALAFRLIVRIVIDDDALRIASWPGLAAALDEGVPGVVPDLLTASIANRDLQAAVAALRSALDLRMPASDEDQPDELGSAYEGLLALVPRLGSPPDSFGLDAQVGGDRRSTGTYYTPPALVDAVLDPALDPLIQWAASADDPEAALLRLAIVDPACGSGRFLVAAARRLARALLVARGGTGESGLELDRALQDVADHCIFGVDLSPAAVELCTLNYYRLTGCPSCVIPHMGQNRAPLNGPLRGVRLGNALIGGTLAARAAHQHAFDWHAAFPDVFRRGGFDVVIGNPPWIAHAGRAAQPLPEGVKSYYKAVFSSFAGYPSTHGNFILQAARLLRPGSGPGGAPGGRLGLVVPSSVSELKGYEPTRRAHDALCAFPVELTDFGEGRFEGVTQPCMALASVRIEGGRTDAKHGSPWPVARPDLDVTARALLARVAAWPCLPAELFGERGLQSDGSVLPCFRTSATPVGRHDTPVREGSDVVEFQLCPPRVHVNAVALGRRLRPPAAYEAVAIVVRQTARYPIAAFSDGMAFRNSLLAVYATDEWPAGLLLALLNSTAVRWLHAMRFRDARQPVLPQMKIGHLRAIPCPPCLTAGLTGELAALGRRLGEANVAISPADRLALDALVGDAYGLRPEERAAIEGWRLGGSSTR